MRASGSFGWSVKHLSPHLSLMTDFSVILLQNWRDTCSKFGAAERQNIPALPIHSWWTTSSVTAVQSPASNHVSRGMLPWERWANPNSENTYSNLWVKRGCSDWDSDLLARASWRQRSDLHHCERYKVWQHTHWAWRKTMTSGLSDDSGRPPFWCLSRRFFYSWSDPRTSDVSWMSNTPRH